MERGVEGVSIDDITREAGVAKGSFYRYFDDREALVRVLVEPGRARIRTAFDRAGEKLETAERREQLREAYLRLGRELAAVLLSDASMVRLHLQESRGPCQGPRSPFREFEEELYQRSLALTRIAVDRGMLRGVHPTVSTLAVIGAAERLLDAWFRDKLDVDPTRATRDLIELVLEGIAERNVTAPASNTTRAGDDSPTSSPTPLPE